MKKQAKKLSVKFFIIVTVIVFILVMAIVAIVGYINKKQFEEKKLQAMKDAFKAYETGVTVEFSDYLEYCEWEKNDINAIVLGLSIDGSNVTNHYIDDNKVIDEIIKVFEDAEFCGANDNVLEECNDIRAEIQFIGEGKEYSLVIRCNDTDYEGVEIGYMTTCYPFYNGATSTSFPDLYKVTRRPIFYNENIYSKLLDIYNENIEEITIDKIKEFKTENSTELTEYYRYMHTWVDTKNFLDEKGDLRITWISQFPIKGTDCYMEVERYNEGGGGSGDENTHLEIIRVEIFNESGESIDLFECSDEEFENFIN